MQPIYYAMASSKMRLYAHPSAAILSLTTKEQKHLGSRQWTAPPERVPSCCCQCRGNSTGWYRCIVCKRTQIVYLTEWAVEERQPCRPQILDLIPGLASSSENRALPLPRRGKELSPAARSRINTQSRAKDQ